MGSDLPLAEEINTIVLVGSFNPGIFHPSWFAKENLISSEEIEKATVNFIIDELSSFRLDWVEVEVQRQRFMLATKLSSHVPLLRDLILGVCRILQHIPVRAIGFNYSAHLQTPSEESWHRVGNTLAPKEFWADFLLNPGMQRLAIQAEREDEYRGHQLVAVEPSAKIENGLFFDLNNHIEVPGGESGASWVVEAVEKLWQPHLDRIQVISERLRLLAQQDGR